MKTLLIAALIALLAVPFAGCGGSESGTQKAPEVTPGPAPEKVAVVPGKKVQNKPASKNAD